MKTLKYHKFSLFLLPIIEYMLPIISSLFAVTPGNSMMEMCHLGLSGIRKNVDSI